MIDKRVFDKLVIAGNTNSGASYWQCSKCQDLSSNEKSAMKYFTDTDNITKNSLFSAPSVPNKWSPNSQKPLSKSKNSTFLLKF